MGKSSSPPLHNPALAESLRSRSSQASNGCWEWRAGCHTVGYGSVSPRMGGGYAHRAMFLAVHGAIPAGMHVLHRCDNRKCINPEHLFVGSHLDNIADMHAKNRQRGGSMPNEKNPNCRFSDAHIASVRNAYKCGESSADVQRRYGISETHFYRVIKGVSRSTQNG